MASFFTVAAVLAALVGAASAQSSVDQNTWDGMVRKTSSCADKYNTLIAGPFYTNDTTCGTMVFTALDTYVKANCPDTSANSEVWKCMNGWDGSKASQDRVNAWKNFLSGCEIMYIANRQSSGESESGFVWQDNSCFPRFNDMASFVSYLQGGPGGVRSGNAAAASVSALTVVFGALGALALARF